MSHFDYTHHGDEIIISARTESNSWRAAVKRQTGIGEFRSYLLEAPSQTFLLELIRVVLK